MGQQKSGHVTLLDVARACGFSVSTVSIVLSEAPLSQNVAERTRQRIRETAQQLGYHPDAYARSLRRRHSQTIGVLAYDLTDPFCIPIVRGMQAGLQPAGFALQLMDAQTKRSLFDDYLKKILERRAEGVAVIASWVFEEANLLADIEKNHVPVVILGRDLTGRRFSSVLVDNVAGGALAMRHLLDLGHRKIAVIRGRKAAQEAGGEIDERMVFELPGMVDPTSGFEGGVQFARQLVAARRTFTAVLAFDDLTALGVVRGLAEAGLHVPDDCSVVGFDDVLPASVATPAITTIRQPLAEMGLAAARMLVETLAAREPGMKRSGPAVYIGAPELVARASSAPPRTPATRGRSRSTRS